MHSATVFFALAAVVATATASPVVANDIYAYPAYKYSYGVADKLTGDQKSANEIRDGGVTKGSYSLVQPDGVVRTVVYQDVGRGFEAQVINKGVAGHPAIIGKGVGLGGAGLGLGLGARSVVGLGGLGLGVAPVGLGLGGAGLVGLGGAGYGLGLGGVGLGLGGIRGAGLGLGLGGAGLGYGLGGGLLGAGIIG